ncbi:ATP-binding protein [Streptomyces sp. NPDC000410]|uniref:ATP-binding protein n=1 Tax=Streptomyces sp. NPDC000410 TaxID=3154254 RepID=UPI0033240BBB
MSNTATHTKSLTRTYSTRMPCSAHAPRLCRKTLGLYLTVDGFDAIVDNAGVCVSEIVTNVVQHTESPDLVLTVTVRQAEVYVEVRDRGSALIPVPPVPPERPPLEASEESGRGLLLVDSLASRWGVEYFGGARRPYGKCVWFELGAAR